MPEPAAIACPHCDSKFKLKDRSKLGQKMLCPKCKKPFKAAEQVDDEDEFAALDDSEVDDTDDELPASRRGSKSGPAKGKSQPKGKSRKKTSGSNRPLIIGGVSLLVLVGVGVLIWSLTTGGGQQANSIAGPAPVAGAAVAPAAPVQPAPVAAATVAASNSIDFSWLPPQAEAVVFVRPADFLKSSFAQWLIDASGSRADLDRSLTQLRQEAGVGVEDLERITIASKTIEDLAAGGQGIRPGAMPDPLQLAIGLSALGQKEIVGVARFSKPVDFAKNPHFMQMTEAVTYNSVSYYRDKSPPGRPASSYTYFPTPELVVVCGREDIMKGLIDRQGKAEPRPELFVDRTRHIVIAAVIKPQFADALPNGPAGATNPKAAFKKLQSASFGIKATDGLELAFSQVSPDAKTAEEVQATTQAVLTEALTNYSRAKSTMPKVLGSLGETLLGRGRVLRHERLVHLATDLPGEGREGLKLIPGEVFAMLLNRGPGGLGATPGVRGPNVRTTFVDDNQFKGELVVLNKPEGIPPEITLQGRAGWDKAGHFEQEGKSPEARSLVFEMDYLNGPAAKAFEYGQIQVTKVEVDPAQRLKSRNSPDIFAGAQPYRDFVSVKRDEFLSDHPENGVRLKLYFDRPSILPSKFTALEGTVTLTVADESQEIVVPDLFDQEGKPVANAALKAAGFTIIKRTGGQNWYWNFMFAPGAKIGDLKLIGENGTDRSTLMNLMRVDIGDAPNFGCTTPVGKDPKFISAKIALHTKTREVKLPFRFGNVPLPAPPDASMPPAVPWKLSTAKTTLPQGLTVDGRLKWTTGPVFDNKPAVYDLELAVDVTGPQVPIVVATGFYKLDQSTTNAGSQLKTKVVEEYRDQSKQYDSPGDPQFQPPNGVEVRFNFGPQQAPIKRLETVSGSFKLLIAKERKKVSLEKILSQIGKPVTNPDLKAAGIDLKFSKDEKSVSYQLTKGHPFAITGVKLIRATPKATRTELSSYNPSSKNGTIFLGDDQLTPNDGADIVYYTGISEIEIPFAFEKLDVPPMPAPPAK